MVRRTAGEPDLLYIDLHLVHEVTSPQAFDGLRAAGRTVRRPDLTLATEDHNVPTLDILAPDRRPREPRADRGAAQNAAEFGIRLAPMGDRDQGIVHVIGPQLGLTQPGMTIVCGDSHTSTHGAFGALAFGIGTSEVEHVLATQTLPQYKPKKMAVTVDGELRPASPRRTSSWPSSPQIGTGGGQGHVIEYRGSAIEALSMEGRMTICNMSIEAGAKAGLIAPDETTFAYLKGRPYAPKGADWDAAVAYWRRCGPTRAPSSTARCTSTPPRSPRSSPGAPTRARACRSTAPCPTRRASPTRATAAPPSRRWTTWASSPAPRCARSRWTSSSSARAPTAGSRTCGPPPKCCAGSAIDADTRMLVVPGSVAVKAAAEAEGLDKVFLDAGAEWRGAGCSMCLGMNPDKLSRGSGRPPPATATSRAGRARAGAPTWCRPPWPPRPR